MIVRIADSARRDLVEIVAFLADVDPRFARRLGGRVREAAESLARHPKRGAPVTHDGPEELRKLVLSPYILFYTIAPEALTIARILHGSRDLSSLLRATDLTDQDEP